MKCAQRLTTALYDEFTNSVAVFTLIQNQIQEYELVEKMFHLLKFVYNHLKSASTLVEKDESEKLLREHAQQAIKCLAEIDRQTVHVDIVDHLICVILHTDKELKLVRQVSMDFYCLSISLSLLHSLSLFHSLSFTHLFTHAMI